MVEATQNEDEQHNAAPFRTVPSTVVVTPYSYPVDPYYRAVK
jgi:hypothetical protein